MSNKLGGGIRGTAYTGTNADQPPNWWLDNDRPPTAQDKSNYSVGDLWMDNSATPLPEAWMLVSLQGDANSRGQLAHWVRLTGQGTGTVINVQGNSGGLVGPDGNGTLFFIGQQGLEFRGNAGAFTENLAFDYLNLPDTTGTNFGVIQWNGVPYIHNFGPGGGVNGNFFAGRSAGNFTMTTVFATIGIGLNALDSINYGSENVALGASSMSGWTGQLGSQGRNTMIGAATGAASGMYYEFNVGVGALALGGLTAVANQSRNTGIGYLSLGAGNTGSTQDNTALGYRAGWQGLQTITHSQNVYIGANTLGWQGSYNIAIGPQAGSNLTPTPGDGGSSNILIQNPGVSAESNALRLGVQGTGNGQIDKAYVAGIYNTPVDVSTEQPVFIDATGKLGTSTFSAITWTPTLSFGGGSTGIVYVAQEGYYQDLGNMIFYSGSIAISNKGSSTGVAAIGGLPFASSGIFQTQMGVVGIFNITFAVGDTFIWCFNNIGTTTIGLRTSNGVGAGSNTLSDTNFANTTQLTISGFYFRA